MFILAKIPYSKLNLKIDDSIETINWNEQNIEIKKYLPIQDKIEIMESIVNATLEADDKRFSIPQVLINLVLEMVYNYTNISFTEKQKENSYKLYDALVSSKLLEQILAVCGNEYDILQTWIIDILTKIYEQKNSARGILEAMRVDYSNLNLDIETLQKQIQDPENLELLKNIVSNLG